MPGRDAELAAIERLLANPGGTLRSVLLEGEAGIGKSTVWTAGIEMARTAGWTVLAARGSQAETGLSFAGLTDLLDPVIDDVMGELPEPQREALEIALVRRMPTQTPVGPREIGAGTLSVLRSLIAKHSVLIALDDLPWLDDASLDSLRFALRRLDTASLRVLAACRTTGGITTTDQTGIEDVLPGDVDTLRLGPLSAAVIDTVLADRLMLSLPAETVERLTVQTAGNPFWALEVGAALRTAESGHDVLPVPQSLSLLVTRRLNALTQAVRETLLITAALAQPTIALARQTLASTVADVDAAIDEAVAAGVLAESAGRLRPAHPLLGSAVLDGLPPGARTALHGRLTAVVTDPEQRARHMVLAAAGEPDSEIAAGLDAGADAARLRGATHAAAALAEQAIMFTSENDTAGLAARYVTAAQLFMETGDLERTTSFAEQASRIDAETRRRVLPLLVEATYWLRGNIAARDIVAPLIADSSLDVHTRAVVHAVAADVGDGQDTPRMVLAQRAIDLFAEVDGEPDPTALAMGLVYLALARLDAGDGIAFDLMERVRELQRAMPYVLWSQSAEVVVACWLKTVDDLDGSRTALLAVIAGARDHGEDGVLPALYGNLAIGEVFAGRYASAREAVEEASRISIGSGGMPLPWKAAAALLTAFTGDLVTARAMVTDWIAGDEDAEGRDHIAIYSSLTGAIALLQGDDEEAARELSRAYVASLEGGCHEPGRRCRLEGDLGQAWVNTGRLAEAAALGKEQVALGERTSRATLIGVGRRIEGLALAAEGALDDAVAALQRAVAEHERSPLPLELGRSLLALGQVQRRRRDAGAARQSVRAALDRFTTLGAVPYVVLAQAELDKGARRGSGSVLTGSERQVAELVASGMTNREVATRLFASVRTVEGHIAAVYRKLGIRSRSELAGRLGKELDT